MRAAATPRGPNTTRPVASPSTDAAPRSFPLMDGLFQMLPNPGTTWSLDEGVVWLQAVAANLRVAYKFPGTLTVTSMPVAA